MRVLLVEDEQQISKLVKATLEAEGFLVDVAEDGERGAALGQSKDYDLIILDINLPKRSGVEVCQEIRAARKKTPIIVLSVKSETAIKVKMLDSGADDYVPKPFCVNELKARVRALMRRPKEISSDVLRVSDLVVDTKKQIVQRGNEDIDLTRKEFMLLCYLLRNRGTVVSRGMIMEHVWGMDADPFSNTVATHIMSLRRKIERSGKKTLIRTVLGRGYRL